MVVVTAGTEVVLVVPNSVVLVVLIAVVVVVPAEAIKQIFRYATKSSGSVVSREAMFWYSLVGPSCCFLMSMPLFRSLARLPFASVVTSTAASSHYPMEGDRKKIRRHHSLRHCGYSRFRHFQQTGN